MQSQKFISSTLISTIAFSILLFLLILIISSSILNKVLAASPAFDQSFITDEGIGNQKNDWVQTYGNDSNHLRSDYTNILAVDYFSDGKTLDTTFWLATNLENASTYSQPLKRIRYGFLIAIPSLPPTSGYNGANYNFYIEVIDGKWSEYLYQLSSTGSSALIESKTNYTESYNGTTIGPGHVKLRLDLKSINYPSAYGLSFYTAESYKSNEVRDFTNWIAIPPATIDVLTHPEKIAIRQGETLLVPAEIDTSFSNNVTNISFNNGTDFNSRGLHVSAQTIQPPLFKVEVSPQTAVGTYNIPFEATLLIATTYTTSPTSIPAAGTVDTVTKVVDPEFQASKKYPTTGYIISPANLTINVMTPPTVSETFTALWVTYGTLAGVIVVTFSTFFIDYLRRRRERK